MYLIDLKDCTGNRYYSNNFDERVAIGASYEDLIVKELELLGLSSYRPKQVFPKQSKLYGKHQRDLHLRLDSVRRLIIEVKSSGTMPFKRPSVLIGDCAGWDKKEFRVGAIIVICQHTGQTAVTSGDSEQWLRIKAKSLSYAVPAALWTPLNVWAASIKDGLYN